MYEAEDHLFNQNRSSITTLSKTRWLSRTHTLSFTIANYTVPVEILEKKGDEWNGQ